MATRFQENPNLSPFCPSPQHRLRPTPALSIVLSIAIMPVATTSIPTSTYEDHYDPKLILNHPDFRILKDGDPELDDAKANIACAYNPAHELHMINKPSLKPGPGEVTVHVRATGVCG